VKNFGARYALLNDVLFKNIFLIKRALLKFFSHRLDFLLVLCNALKSNNDWKINDRRKAMFIFGDFKAKSATLGKAGLGQQKKGLVRLQLYGVKTEAIRICDGDGGCVNIALPFEQVMRLLTTPKSKFRPKK
jgi:hypothetical protein